MNLIVFIFPQLSNMWMMSFIVYNFQCIVSFLFGKKNYLNLEGVNFCTWKDGPKFMFYNLYHNLTCNSFYSQNGDYRIYHMFHCNLNIQHTENWTGRLFWDIFILYLLKSEYIFFIHTYLNKKINSMIYHLKSRTKMLRRRMSYHVKKN
jgi:hypothetical protein